MPHKDPAARSAWLRAHRVANHERLLAVDRERKARYGRPCLDCGTLTNGSNGRAKAALRCPECTALASRIWTAEAIIMAIQTFVARYGRLPNAAQWNPSHARNIGRPDWAERYYADGDYPQSSTVQNVFGSWNAGIEAAGYEPRGIGKRGPSLARQSGGTT